MLRAVIQTTLVIVGLVLAGLVGINSLVRVGAGGERSHGIIEEWLLGGSLWSILSSAVRSEAFNHWEAANEMSARLASLLSEHGPQLASDPDLDTERAMTAAAARMAYDHASAIPDEYLAASNPELPGQYKAHFVQAMRLSAEGLENSEPFLVREGIEHYNTFLRWIQAQSRDDFRPLK